MLRYVLVFIEDNMQFIQNPSLRPNVFLLRYETSYIAQIKQVLPMCKEMYIGSENLPTIAAV
jgi:hypothetical protein